MPKTLLGKWSTGLIIVFFALFVLFNALVASGQRGGETFFDNLTLTIPIFAAGISAVVAALLGIFSIIRQRERSIFVFVSSLIGFLVLFFVLGEVLSPH